MLLLLFVLSFLVSQNPISDQGADQVVEAGAEVVISGENSYGLDGASITSYQWTVPQEILDANLGLDINSETLTFIAPDVRLVTAYQIELKVTDSNGLTSQVFDAPSLIISEYSETSSSAGSRNKYIEIFNGTGSKYLILSQVSYVLEIFS